MIEFADSFAASATERATGLSSTDLVVDHKLQFWDALIVTAAVDTGCAQLISEDMQDGFVTRGLTNVDPFASTPHPKLAAMLEA